MILIFELNLTKKLFKSLMILSTYFFKNILYLITKSVASVFLNIYKDNIFFTR